jgi:Flp pilus assembly protein TadG
MINSSQERDQGSISLFVVVFFLALLAAAGLIVDGGAKLRTARQASAIAEEAARAGAGRINTDRAYAQGGRFTIAPGTATAAARTHLTTSGATGSATVVNGQQIRVTVTITKPTVLLAAFGISEVSATKTATANLLQGIESEDRGF